MAQTTRRTGLPRPGTGQPAPTGSPGDRRPSVAVVGAGISGLTAAYLLSRTHDVVVLESEDRLGGHAHTHDVAAGATHFRGAAATVPVDSGFIVHNAATYPLLRRLFAELGVRSRPTEMSMSVSCDGCGLEYAGGRGPAGVLADPGRLADRRFAGLLAQVPRFHRRARAFLHSSADDTATTYGDFLAAHRFGDYFVAHYAIPIVACVWSSGAEDAALYPAGYLFRFLDHHGLLRLTGSPRWYTVEGGSRTYVAALAHRLAGRAAVVRTGRPVTDITRHPDGVTVRDVSGTTTRVDKVVIATHADQALALLTDPTDDEVSTLKAFGYSANPTVLHTDATLLPQHRRARASWNYRMRCTAPDSAGHRPAAASGPAVERGATTGRSAGPVAVSYWMNRLHGYPETGRQVLVSLNQAGRIDPARVLATMAYRHPIYTPESVAAQAGLGRLNTARTAYAGAYHGWGFHEDGCRSGAAAAEHFGARW